MRVFIGSTYEDLPDHRRATIEALNKLSVEIEAMEFWYARPEHPLNVCLRLVDQSDVYVCILAHRYGSTHRLKSFTHREYERADRRGIDRLVFIMNSDYPVPARFVDRGIPAWRLQRFKERLRKRHQIGSFGSPGDLAHQVVESIRDLMASKHDEQAKSLDLEEFWRSLQSSWRRIKPPELRIPFQAKDDPVVLLEKMEEELRGISAFHEFIEQSHEALGEDLRNLIERIGADPSTLSQIHYTENPFELRDAELLMLFPNRVYRMQALIAQARVAILERRMGEASEESGEELARAKNRLTEALSRIQID